MPFAEKHHAVQALRLGGLDKPFGKRIQVGTPRRENQRRDATVPQQASKGRSVERISIEDDVLNAVQEALAGGREIPTDLCHPGLVRLTRDAGNRHAAGLSAL